MGQEAQREEKTGLASEVVIDGVTYFNMPIDVAIKYAGKINSGFFVPLSESKRVRIEHGDPDLRGVLDNYKNKGLSNLLFADQDYYAFLRSIKKGLTGFFAKDDPEFEGKTLALTQVFHLMKKAVGFVGIPQEIIEKGEETNRQILTKLRTIPVLYNQYKQFMTDCQDEFLKNMFVGYVCCGLIDALNWNTPGIKEKMIQACLFGDITLSEKDYLAILMCQENSGKLPKHIRNHPLEALKVLRKTKNLVSPETMTIIEQHQELPDGSGYPAGLNARQINQLAAVNIVARAFVNRLIESDFSYDNRESLIEEICKDFDYPNFGPAARGLRGVLGLGNNEDQQT